MTASTYLSTTTYDHGSLCTTLRFDYVRQRTEILAARAHPAVCNESDHNRESSVQQAQQTLGQSEQGALELQQARDKIAGAKGALAKGHHEEAERLAAQAHLYAELAVAKSQSASAGTAADEVLASLEMVETELADLKLKKTERGLVLTLGDVMFDTGQSTLKPGAYATLDRLATALRQQSERKVLIEGHTDNVGSSENNQGLSERRAQSVEMGLMQRGVERSQITALGKGEDFPIAGNETVDGRQSNRRVELIFSDRQTQIASDAGS